MFHHPGPHHSDLIHTAPHYDGFVYGLNPSTQGFLPHNGYADQSRRANSTGAVHVTSWVPGAPDGSVPPPPVPPAGGKQKKAHEHRPTLDPLSQEIMRKFFDEFAKLPDEERKALRERWNTRGRLAVEIGEQYLMHEAKLNSRPMKPFIPLPPPSQALTEKDIAYSHRLSILLGCLNDLPDLSVSLKNFTAFTIGPEPDRRPRTLISDLYRLSCFRKTLRSSILEDVNVHFAPGGMHLIMGPPLSGKSALLRALAGRFKGVSVTHAKFSMAMGGRPLLVTGEALENGRNKRLHDRNPLLYAEAAQYERHIPALSVYETIDFANVLRSIDVKRFPEADSIQKIMMPIIRRLRSRGLLKLFGLEESADTLVGDSIVIRGVSGGQRRRVTSAEPLAGLLRVILLDVPTNGLDTATAAEICRDLKILGFALRQTLIMALMQPPPEVFTLFTTVTMLDEGAVIYHGPIASAERYFRCLGFRRPKGVDLADFLIDMCTFRRENFFKGGSRGLQAFKVHNTISGLSWADGAGPANRYDSLDFGLLRKRVDDAVSGREKIAGWAIDRQQQSDDEDEYQNGYGPSSNVGTHVPPPPGMYDMSSPMSPYSNGAFSPPMVSPPGPMFPGPEIRPGLPPVIGGPNQGPIIMPVENKGIFTRVLDRLLGRDAKPSIWFNDQSIIANTLDAGCLVPMAPDAPGHGQRGSQVVDGHDVLTRDGLKDLWKKSVLYTDTIKAMERSAEDAEEAENKPLYKVKWATGRGTQFKTLAARQWRIYTRTPAMLRGRIVSSIMIGIVLGTLFYELPLTYEFATARIGLLFFVAMSVGFGAMNNMGPWIKERRVFTKQNDLHFFRVAPFVAATTIMALPVSLLEGTIMGTLVWWLCLPNPMFYRYLYFVIVLVLLSFMIASMLRFLAAIAKTEVHGQLFAVVLILGMVVFCGFVLPVKKIPSYFIWIYWANPVKWALEAIAIIVLNKQTFYCEPRHLMTVYEVPRSMIDAVTPQGLDWDLVGSRYVLTNSTATPTFTTSLSSYQVCPFTTGEEALESLGFFHKEFWIFANMAILAAMALGMIILATLTLKFVKFDDEHSIRFPMQRATPSEDLPDCPPLPLIWRGISYSVAVNGGWKPLLNNVSGYALPGTMTALMGESGAGKTTLMDVVAHRKLEGKAEGVIMLAEHDVSSGLPKDSAKDNGFTPPENGIGDLIKAACSGDQDARKALRGKEKRRALMLFKASTGYVLQFDTLCPYETVYESVEFSAALRLVGVSVEERKKRIDMCIRLLELEPVADVQVGGTADISGVSDSQRKLTSIAVELVANPPVIFLDEPTTGLDPQGAVVVIEALRRIADQGRAVLATIHQPSMRLFTAFDRLLLLKRGGRTVYFGPLHSEGPGQDVPAKYAKGGRASPTAADAKRRTDAKRVEDCGFLKRYFANHEGVPKCGDDQNPASWMLDVIGAGASGASKADFADLWTRSPEGHLARKEVDALVSSFNPAAAGDGKKSRQDIFHVTADKPHNPSSHPEDPHGGNPLPGQIAGPNGQQPGGFQPSCYATPRYVPTTDGIHVPQLDVNGNPIQQLYDPTSYPMPQRFDLNGYPVPNQTSVFGVYDIPMGSMANVPPGGATVINGGPGDNKGEIQIRPDFCTQLYWLTWRVGRICWRAPNYSRNRVIIAGFLGLLFGFGYYRMSTDMLGIQARVGFSYMSMLFLIAMSANMALPFWFAHKPCFNRESLGTSMYHPLTHALALTFVDVFYTFAQVSAFVLPAYWIIDLGPRADTFFTYYLLIFLAVLWGTYFGQMLVFWKQTLPDAQMFFGLLMPLITLFNGFIIRRTQIPMVWIWVHYANPFRWLLESIVSTILKPIETVDCSNLQLTDRDPMLITECPMKNGTDYVLSMDMWPNMQWPDVAIFIGFVILFRLLGFLAICVVKPPAT